MSGSRPTIDAQTLRNMPVSKLKEMLVSNNIPIDDCIEKEDLVRRAMISMFRATPPANPTASTYPTSPQKASTTSTSSSSNWSSFAKSSLDIPEEFLCPISQCIMFDPVLTENGYAYSRKQITQWLASHSTEPLTNEKITHRVLVPDRLRLQRMRAWAEQNEEKLLSMEELPVAEEDHLFITMEVFYEEDIKDHVSEKKLELLWFDDGESRTHHFFSWSTLKEISQKLLSTQNKTGDAKIFGLTKRANGTIRPYPYHNSEINQPIGTLFQEKRLSQKIYIMFPREAPQPSPSSSLLFFKLFDAQKNRMFEYLGHGLLEQEDTLEKALHYALRLAGEVPTIGVNYVLHEEEEISATGLKTLLITAEPEGRSMCSLKIADIPLGNGDILVLEIQRLPTIGHFWKSRVADPMWGSRQYSSSAMNED